MHQCKSAQTVVGPGNLHETSFFPFQGLNMLITLEALHYDMFIITSHASELQRFKHGDFDRISTWIPKQTSEFLREPVAAIQHFMGLAGTAEKSGWPVLLMWLNVVRQTKAWEGVFYQIKLRDSGISFACSLSSVAHGMLVASVQTILLSSGDALLTLIARTL